MGGRGRQTRGNFYKTVADHQRGYQQFVPQQQQQQKNWQDVKQTQPVPEVNKVPDNIQNNLQTNPPPPPAVSQSSQCVDSSFTPETGGTTVQEGFDAQNLDANMTQASVNHALVDENGKLQFNKIFKTRKKPSVRNKEKKLRQNRQLRRAIFPKNALMAMNELKGLNVSEFAFTMGESGGFNAVVTVNGKQHEGKGPSKAAAKNAACESVLRDFVIAKMIQKPRPTKRSKNNSISSNGNEEGGESMDYDDTQSVAESQGNDEGEELPMINIASFALHKLFTEWEREGYVVPELHPNESDQALAPPGEPAAPKEPTNRTELPKNWEYMHPATLLCMMRPGLAYVEYGSSGDKNNISHRVGVVVDGQEFIESGRSKKIARKNTAIRVCNALFGTNFVKEEPNPSPEK